MLWQTHSLNIKYLNKYCWFLIFICMGSAHEGIWFSETKIRMYSPVYWLKKVKSEYCNQLCTEKSDTYICPVQIYNSLEKNAFWTFFLCYFLASTLSFSSHCLFPYSILIDNPHKEVTNIRCFKLQLSSSKTQV